MTALQKVAFRFQLSDWTLFNIHRTLLVRSYGIEEQGSNAQDLVQIPDGCPGVMLRSVSMPEAQAGISKTGSGAQECLRYVMQCFPRYYIEMTQTFDEYKEKFSGKTRATLTRKVKKFAELGGGEIRWERLTRPDELDRFWKLAREVSVKTYQERLLDAGLPDDADFIAQARALAANDCLRAFLLFDGDRPIAYLFCPVQEGVVLYAYLGYDPGYLKLSVGTVLQWLALESLFAEQRFRYFDFTEGESEQKRMFSTAKLTCANVALLRPSFANRLLLHSHCRFVRLVEGLGDWLEAHQLKSKVRRWLRFGFAKVT